MGRVDIYPSSVLQLPPSAMLGLNNLTSDFAVVGAGPVTVTDMTVTITVPAGRQIKISAKSQLKSTATSSWLADVFDNGSNVGRAFVGDFTGTGRIMMDGQVVLSPTAGSHTYDIRFTRFSGTGDLTVEGTGGGRYLEVEDVTGTLWNGTTVTAGMIASEPWVDWTPVWTQGVTVTATVSQARYVKHGRLVNVSVRLDATGAGTATSALLLNLPFNAFFVTTEPTFGAGFFYDASANLIYPVHIQQASATQIRFRGVTSTANSDFGTTGSPFALAIASGDILSLGFTYESTT